MTITPAIKGQLTKAIKAQAKFAEQNGEVTIETCLNYAERPEMFNAFTAVRAVFIKHMPREQAKHATRKYLATL